jgi:two-component system OmpR family sensor kinase
VNIRTRLAIAVAIVLMVTIALLGTALVRSTRDTLVDQVDEQVLANADRGQSDVGRKPKYGNYGPYTGSFPQSTATASNEDTEPANDIYERTVARYVYSSTGELLVDEPCGFVDSPKPAPKVPDVTSSELSTVLNRIVTTPSVDGSLSYRMLVQRSANGETLVTASPLDTVDAAISRLVRMLIISGAIAMIAATALCWWLIRRGMRPVDDMVDTAAAIAAGDLSRRVPDADPRTELGRLGGALNEMLGQIESAIDARSASENRLRRFVADAAHELRTPLTSLRGYAELYRQGAIRDEAGVTNAMGRIEAEGARMSRLVDDLLLLARMDQQRGLEMKSVDLAALMDEATGDFRVVDPNRPLTVDIARGSVVRGDRIRLRQIIDNLLTNTRIHTPPGTPVHVSLRRELAFAEISVADEGPGISAEDQARVFERFWRADPARTRKTGGSGLGLAIVASLVEAHGGTVSVRSTPGAGTAFIVRIPLTADPAA